MANHSSRFQRVPREHPHCPYPVDLSHGGVRAGRNGCICHGAPEKVEADRAKDRARWQNSDRRDQRAPIPAATAVVGGRATPTAPATDAERRVFAHPDKPCEFEDPELFYVVGDGPTAAHQERAAKRVCQGCPVQVDCLTAAFQIGDRYSVRGGTTPAERRVMRRHGAGAVAS